MSEFTKAYEGLNKAQKDAVDAIEGAVLVIAGPGTGKTQLLSVRVANILDKSDSLPENILCLTFTNKAANNMQLRLSSMIGSAGQRVVIKTFHSFAAEVMNLYPEYFWNGATLINVPDAVQLEIVTDILSALPLDNPLALKFAGQFTATGEVIKALRLTKEAGLTPDKLRSLIALNLDYIETVEPELVDICSERLSYKKLDELAMRISELPDQPTDALTRPLVSLSTVIAESFETAHSADNDTGKTKNSSAWKTRWVQTVAGEKGMHEERKRNNWWLQFANVYETYRTTLHERGYFDYSDMIIEVIAQLEKNADMLADIQERYQYVLIDEFQDTNAAQLRLAHLVADHYVAEGNPNIMAVGDDDQSIYKFNGAELSNMLDFERSYPKLKRFVLTDNYRSSQAVLDFSKQVIEQAGERITTRNPELSKQLVAKNEPSTPGQILHMSYPTKEHEYYGIANNIKKLKDTKAGSIAVLARGHDSLRSVAHALKEQGVAVRYEQQQSIFDLPLVAQVITLCEIISSVAAGEEQEVNSRVPQLLAHEAWRASPLQLWELAIKNRQHADWLTSLTEHTDENLQTIGHWLLWLAQASRTDNINRMLEYMIGLSASEHMTSPLRAYFLESETIDTPYLTSISAVKKLMTLAQDFSKQGQVTLGDFVRLIAVSRDNNSPITDQSLFVTAPDAVELLTIHKAKGLEFDSVFVVDAMESIWRPSSRGKKPPANLPLRPNGDTYDDYVRLMFVAVTRAKQNVFVNSFYTSADGDPTVPSAIIRDILPMTEMPYRDGPETIAAVESAMRWPRLEHSQEAELLRGIIETYTLSPSAILDFLDVSKGGPRYFLEKYLLRLPEPQSVRAAFGIAVHTALETAQQTIIDKTYSLASTLTTYEQALQKQLLNAGDYERYLVHGQQVISRLFNEHGFLLSSTGRPEVALSVRLSTTIVKGKLDHLDVSDEGFIITDYKTGTPLGSFITKNKTKQLKAWRHRTQLQFYTLMLMASGQYKQGTPIKAQMLYVEAEELKELARPYIPTPDELTQLERLTNIVSEKIVTLNLPDVRHYSEDMHGIAQFIEDLLAGTI